MLDMWARASAPRRGPHALWVVTAHRWRFLRVPTSTCYPSRVTRSRAARAMRASTLAALSVVSGVRGGNARAEVARAMFMFVDVIERVGVLDRQV